jgi:exopolysaccharide biosynthesis protein
MGCGPRLVINGRVVVDAAGEGFSHPKILRLACVRSAVGLTEDGFLLLVTCSPATISQLAHVLQSFGAYQAMNLDGGASTGLWCRGGYLTRPGREISNTLLVLERNGG